MVSTLLLLTCSLSVSVYWGWRHALITTHVATIAQHLVYAQRCAMAHHKQELVTFNPAHDTYTCAGITHHLSQGIHFLVPPGVKGPPALPTRIITTPITFKNNQVLCTPSGVKNAGTIYLSDQDTVCALSVSVGFSGIKTYRLHGNRWTQL